ncbi:FAD-dependent oxidoreductase [Pseudomonas aeruginosa]|uniref:FAD-dependent oxidoreductase n=1 Tax=Pseudomonas aeruginosa TaxID=287 RepID=UPI001045F254|nr:FAD-dependent oxidoreductase [Pseudomonas aeruginosa]
MSQILKTSLLIVGGGPGGYVAAIRAGQLGIPTVLVEGAALGGTCLNVGCIPSKALIHAAEEYLKARHYAGRSALGIQVQAPSIDIARTVEWKDAIVDRLTSGVAALLKKHGVDVVQGWARILDGKSVAVELAGGGSQRIECEHLLLAAGSQSVELPILPLVADQVLVAVGRKPRSEGWNLESLGLDMNGRAVKVDDQCRTSMRNVWAIGDLAGEPMLAHRAMAQGEMVAELIAGKRRQFAPVAIPAVCFTDPEVVVAGLSPEQAKDAGLDCLVASFPFAANGRAMTLEANEGFVRVVARRDNHLVVGWQAVGKAVSELSTAFAQSLEMGARLEDIAGTIHAHPTLGEAVQEAALRALGHALHI